MNAPIIYRTFEEVPAGAATHDVWQGTLTELFFVRNPQWKKGMPDAEGPLAAFVADPGFAPVYAYFPWRNATIKMVPESAHMELHTARNRNIITKEEQEKYASLRVGIAGLSVGASGFHALVATGGPKQMKIADMDTLEVSNLNRIRGTLFDIGKEKTTLVAHAAWELDPFLDLEIWDRGVAADTLEQFILDPKLDIFIDEMDNLELKLRARLICKAHDIPLLMATDNGDGVILDVERYDSEPDTLPFHGRIGETTPEVLAKLSRKEWVEHVVKIIDPTFMTAGHRNSLPEIGRTIGGPPQLYSAASASGAMITYAVRAIANGASLPSGKYNWIPEMAFTQ